MMYDFFPGLFGMFVGLGILLFFLGIGVYVYAALALMKIAQRTKTKNGWFAFIPFLNFYLMIQMAKLPNWWLLALLLPFIPAIGGAAFIAVVIYFWWLIAGRLKRPNWWGLLMIIPIVNLVMMGIMAWGKK